MYKTDEEIETLLRHPNNGLVKLKIIGSGNHSNQSTDNKRSGEQKRSTDEKAEVGIIGNLLGGRMAEVLTGSGSTQVSQYSRGLNSSNNPDAELKDRIGEKLESISKKAAEKVEVLLDIFHESKMEELKAGEIPGAAEKLMGLVEKVGKFNGKDGSGTPKPTVVIFAPKQQNIENYIVKEI